MIFRQFAAFIAHDDAAKVTPDDAAKYKAHLLAAKQSQGTVSKYIANLRNVFALAKANRKISINPWQEVKFTPAKGASRQDGFSMAEMALIVEEACKTTKAVVRIPVLIAAYSGACLAEITEAHVRDFEETPNGLVFHIREKHRPDGQRVKTEFRPRRFPLHSAIVEEVRAYLATIGDGPLFPDVKLDRYGKAAHNAGETLRKWIKAQGINRKGIGFHAFRHSFKTAMRRVIRDEEIRNYIEGHASGVAADYGRYPIATLREAIESVPADPLRWELE